MVEDVTPFDSVHVFHLKGSLQLMQLYRGHGMDMQIHKYMDKVVRENGCECCSRAASFFSTLYSNDNIENGCAGLVMMGADYCNKLQ